MKISVNQLRRADWKLVMTQNEVQPFFKVYTNTVAPQLTMTHSKHGDKPVKIVYRVFMQPFDNLTGAVRAFNEETSRRAGRRQASGSVEALRAIKAKSAGYGN